jgi:hypothetical protein
MSCFLWNMTSSYCVLCIVWVKFPQQTPVTHFIALQWVVLETKHSNGLTLLQLLCIYFTHFVQRIHLKLFHFKHLIILTCKSCWQNIPPFKYWGNRDLIIPSPEEYVAVCGISIDSSYLPRATLISTLDINKNKVKQLIDFPQNWHWNSIHIPGMCMRLTQASFNYSVHTGM